MTTTQSATIRDRNEVKFLVALGFKASPSPRTPIFVDFEFEQSEDLFDARRAYSLNHTVPVLTFIRASEYVDNIIAEHRRRSSGGGPR